jgi:hypothetical protein
MQIVGMNTLMVNKYSYPEKLYQLSSQINKRRIVMVD